MSLCTSLNSLLIREEKLNINDQKTPPAQYLIQREHRGESFGKRKKNPLA